MKKVISIALIAMLVVAMAGCSQSQPAPTAAPAETIYPSVRHIISSSILDEIFNSKSFGFSSARSSLSLYNDRGTPNNQNLSCKDTGFPELYPYKSDILVLKTIFATPFFQFHYRRDEE